MDADYLIHFCYLLALLISKVHLIESCVYIVESRRVIEMRNLPEPEHMPVQVHLIEHPFGVCEIPAPLRDRWMLVTEDKERIRIRSHSMTVRYPHVSNTTKVKYRCLESKGHTFLLG
ncbi:hypothetical protein DPMN_164876 [Dreissena polymorpha]|uniref:Uncharacterized protein n=1 Tax=Dreissena polymorpha TaxID=45954 RepID=A0A9D4EZJ6_DREPO|nr:hypothetical protein DPMN_164876 [Dreissena polymorpha]